MGVILAFMAFLPSVGATVAVSDIYWGGILDTGTSVSKMTGEFDMPTIYPHCGSDSNTNVAIWIGIGGNTTNRFMQMGMTVGHDSNGGWYEFFDSHNNGPVVGEPFSANPGDHIRLRIVMSDDRNSVQLIWYNVTTGNRFEDDVSNVNQYYVGNSAEWMTERSRANLADFDTIPFSGDFYTDSTGTHNQGDGDFRYHIVSSIDGLTAIQRTTVTNPNGFDSRWAGCR